MEVIEVGTADFKIAFAGQILETRGIGSCVVVCLYDRTKKIGALAHIMLAHCTDERLNPLRFVDTALPLVIRKLAGMGTNTANLNAHLIGGASMFASIEDYLKLGDENIKAAQLLLTDMNITIKSKEVGGKIGRSVKFFLDSGEIQVTIK
jgi:chemotaxis protein CheD